MAAKTKNVGERPLPLGPSLTEVSHALREIARVQVELAEKQMIVVEMLVEVWNRCHYPLHVMKKVEDMVTSVQALTGIVREQLHALPFEERPKKGH